MPTTTYKQYPLPTQGVTTTWGDALNNYPFTYIDDNLGGVVTKTLSSSNVLLTVDESRMAILRLIGTLTTNLYIATLCQGFTFVENLTTGPYTIIFTNTLTYGSGALGAQVIIPQGGRYVVISDTVNGCRLLLPATSATASTVGMIADFPGRTPPNGWLKANGSLVSRASYPALYAYAVASAMVMEADWFAGYYGWFGSGDGGTNFRLPDLRGRFRRSWADNLTSSRDYGRDAGTFQDQALLAHNHTGTTGGQSATHTHSYNGPSVAGGNYSANGTDNAGPETSGTASNDHTHNITTNLTGGAQNVPENVSMMTCVAYV